MMIYGTAFSQVGSYPGSFARMGFGARGLAMGNALVSDVFGNISGYYNPALACFQEQGVVNLGYTFLNLDRKLNFVSFSRKFKIPKQKKGGAGISLYWINAGVTDIDGRDNDTRSLGMLSTFENLFNLSTSFLVDEKLSLGVGFKLYYAKLYEKVTATSIAFDAGAVYKAMKQLSFAIAVKDISAKYKWDTSQLYGSFGNVTENKFPVVVDFGVSYLLPKNLGIVSGEFETFINPKLEDKISGTVSKRTYDYFLKLGTEINIISQLQVRAGLDRIQLNGEDFWGNLKPGAGFAFTKSFSEKIMFGVEYSFQLEPYTKNPIQNLGVIFKFN